MLDTFQSLEFSLETSFLFVLNWNSNDLFKCYITNDVHYCYEDILHKEDMKSIQTLD